MTIQGIGGKAIYIKQSEYQKLHNIRESNVNRNNFTNVTLLGVGTGVYIEYGNTNKFVNLALEGTTNGIYVDNTINQLDSNMWATEDNMFVNVTMESTTNEIYNNSNGTKFFNISTQYNNTTNVFLIVPQVYLGGINPEFSLEKMLNIYKINYIHQQFYSF